jgi:hypothetical protein
MNTVLHFTTLFHIHTHCFQLWLANSRSLFLPIMAYSSSSSPEISVGPTVDTQDHFSYKHASHDEVLEDLSRFVCAIYSNHHNTHSVRSRFILNLPDEELASLERICFQVEQAYAFFLLCSGQNFQPIFFDVQPLVLRGFYPRRKSQISLASTQEILSDVIPCLPSPTSIESRPRAGLQHFHAVQDTSSRLWCYYAE